MLENLKKVYNEFPRLFWIVVGTRFVDAFGSTLLFPFFALYITQRFGVGMTQAGVLLGMSSLFGLIGSMAGGALADKFGRRQLILFGLIFSAISSLSLGLANDIRMLYPLIIIVGLAFACGGSSIRSHAGGYSSRRKKTGRLCNSTHSLQLCVDFRNSLGRVDRIPLFLCIIRDRFHHKLHCRGVDLPSASRDHAPGQRREAKGWRIALANCSGLSCRLERSGICRIHFRGHAGIDRLSTTIQHAGSLYA